MQLGNNLSLKQLAAGIKFTKPKSSNYYFYLGLVIVFAILLRFFMLTRQSLWYDEGLSLINSDASNLQESIMKILGIENANRFQPLYFIILAAWRNLFGDTEYALRSFSALFGIGTTIIIYFTALKIYGKNHALWSLTIAAFSSFLVYYSQEVRPYALLLFITALQMFLFSQILDKKKDHEQIYRISFWICSGLGLLGSIMMVIFNLALCLSHILIFRNLKNWVKWWIPTLFFAIPAFLFYFYSPNSTDPESIRMTRTGFPIIQNALFVLYGILTGITYGPPQDLLRGTNKMQVLQSYWPYLVILLLVAISILLALIITFWHSNKDERYQQPDRLLISIFIIAFVLSIPFALITKMNWLPRHTFFLYIPLVILLPSTFLHYRQQNGSFSRIFRLGRLAIITLIFLNCLSLSHYYFNKDYYRDDYRSVAQYMVQHQTPSNSSVIFSGSGKLFNYYDNQITIYGGWHYKSDLQQGNFAKLVENLTNHTEQVLIAVNRDPLLQNSLTREMSPKYSLEHEVKFPGFRVYHFKKNKNKS
jgi:4-amino-4-deoxy-L-arabinose transferase-like glycosyltransferase